MLVSAVIAAILLSHQVPTLITSPVLSGAAVSGETVSCSHGSWTNSPTSYAYAWKRDGTTIGGQSASTLALGAPDVGASVKCAVRASNGSGAGAPAESNGLIVYPPGSGNLWVSSSPGSGCVRSDALAGYNSATDCTLGDAITAAQPADVIMFRAGDYGLWQGTDKAVTLRAETGQRSTIGLNMAAGDCCFTLDGGPGIDFKINNASGGAAFGSGVTDITVKNTEFSGTSVSFGTPGPDSGIVFDHNWLHGETSPCLICFFYDASAPRDSGVTIRNSLFEDTGADGITSGTGVVIENNLFRRVQSSNPESHTDAIQGNGASHYTIRGNMISDCNDSAGVLIGTFGSVDNLIEHNVFSNCGNDLQANQVDGLTIRWNTIAAGIGTESIWCFNGSNVSLSDNVAGDYSCDGVISNTHNMFYSQSVSAPNFTGAPVYTGGPAPTTFDGFCLAPLSPGYTGATDGGQVGACGGGFTGGPPDEWYGWVG